MWNALLWFFIFILGLSFFGISLEAIVNSPAGQANFSYLLFLLGEIGEFVIEYIRNIRP